MSELQNEAEEWKAIAEKAEADLEIIRAEMRALQANYDQHEQWLLEWKRVAEALQKLHTQTHKTK